MEDGGWVFDPSLGRRTGRPVSSREAIEAKQRFAALHAIHSRRIDRAAKLFITVVLTVPFLSIAGGMNMAATAVFVLSVTMMLGIVGYANLSMYKHVSLLWNRVQARPNTAILSEAERIRRGYRMDWVSRVKLSVGVVLLLPAYLAAHLGRGGTADIPVIGPTFSRAYWAILLCTLAAVPLYFFVRAIANKLRTRRHQRKGSRPTSDKIPPQPARRQGKSVQPYPRGDLSGVERMRR